MKHATTNRFKAHTLLAPMLCVGFISACSNEKTPNDSATNAGESNANYQTSLVTVNGESISKNDVDFMIGRTFSGAEQLFFNDEMQSKVLESLVASTAMRQKMLSELSPDQIHDIEQRTKAYREELFVKEYLVQNATPEPVSTQMVKSYYEQYPEEFGGGDSRLFEMLTTPKSASDEVRNSFLQKTGNAADNRDWNALAQPAQVLVYTRSEAQAGLLDPKLDSALNALKVGDVSNVVMIDGAPHILRLLETKKLPAEPLHTVSASIRKKLAAIQLKKAVKAASERAISESEVVYK